jgi:hypothetical protein
MSSFASRYISEVEGGKGLVGGAGSAIKGSAKDFTKQFGKENIVRNMFGGSDIFSALIRSKLGVKLKPEKDKKPSAEGSGGEGISAQGITFLKIIAKNSMSLPGMARDMNVLRQNVQKLVKIKAGPQKKGTKAYATKADTFFLREDERERALEAQRLKVEGKPTAETPTGKDKEGGFLNSIIQMFSGGFTSAIKTLFSPKMLMKVFSKVFVPLAIIGTLFSGITAGFKKYQETGNLGEAIVSGLGGMLNFVTFGLFGEDTLKSLFDSISGFFKPITDTISSIFTGIKDFVKGLFGGKVDVKDDAPAKADDVKPTMPDPKQFATGMAKASGVSNEKAADIGGVFDAVGRGDMEGVIGKAQEFAKKYPQEPTSETSPTRMNNESGSSPTQRTGDVSASEPPTPLPVQSSTTPAPSPIASASPEDKIKELENHIESNKKRFAKRQADASRHIASFEKRYKDDPERVKELKDAYKVTLDGDKNQMELANAEFQNQIGSLRKSSSGSVSAGGTTPSVESGGGATSSAPASSVSASGGSGAGGSASMAEGGQTAPSGTDVSQTSSSVAEGQRMESAADMGSLINSPTTNSSTSSPDKPSSTIADAYDSDLAQLLART